MTFKTSLIYSPILRIKLLKPITNFIGALFIPVLVFSLTFASFNFDVLASTEKQTDQLVDRISRDFTRKFCNSIAFGLSKDSAMDFANKENKLIFKNKKGINDLNNKLIASNIASSVVETCGYPLNLIGEDGIAKFEDYYISTNKQETE